MVAQGTTAQQIYDPENEGAWDGQLPHADLVDQLPPESPKPTAWPKVFDRLAWADGGSESPTLSRRYGCCLSQNHHALGDFKGVYRVFGENGRWPGGYQKNG